MSTSALDTEVAIMSPTVSTSDLEVELLVIVPSRSVSDLDTEMLTMLLSANGPIDDATLDETPSTNANGSITDGMLDETPTMAKLGSISDSHLDEFPSGGGTGPNDDDISNQAPVTSLGSRAQHSFTIAPSASLGPRYIFVLDVPAPSASLGPRCAHNAQLPFNVIIIPLSGTAFSPTRSSTTHGPNVTITDDRPPQTTG